MKENIGIGLVLLAIGGGFTFFYVKPADAFRHAVMGCMADHGDSSRAGYDACVVSLRGDK